MGIIETYNVHVAKLTDRINIEIECVNGELKFIINEHSPDGAYVSEPVTKATLATIISALVAALAEAEGK